MMQRLLGLLTSGVAIPGGGAQPRTAEAGSANGPVPLGPARTGGDIHALSNLFASHPVNAPTFEEFRDAMRGAGMLR